MSDLSQCFGVFGDPIAHSRSPRMHSAAFEALGLPHRYLPFRVSVGQLGVAVRGAAALGFGGVNLTTPLKRAAATLCDEVSDTAQRIGAINTLRFVSAPGDYGDERIAIHGHNTDARGFLDGLDELDVGPAPLRRATVLGAGGASLAVVDSLLNAYPELELTWVSRRPKAIPELTGIPNGEARVRKINWHKLGRPRGELLVNTTTVGLGGGADEFPIPIELDELERSARVVDIVYPRPPGGLLDRAAERGFAVQDGLPMLLWQGVRALELWFDIVLPDPVVAAMRAALDD